MRPASRRFLEALLSAPSPSGFEGPVRDAWRKEVAGFADRVTTDVHGNCVGALHADGAPRVMLAGHMDELGFLIKHVDERGFLSFDTVGGFDATIIPGRKVRIYTKKGPLLGVIGKKPAHAIRREDEKKTPDVHEMWIDVGATSDKEARSLVSIGDPATYDPSFEVMRNDLATSRGFDDRMGAWVVAETLRAVAEARGKKGGKAKGSRKKAGAALFAVATVQEEVGLRGAHTSTYGIAPDVGIAVDVGVASDHPGMDKRRYGDVRVGSGPVILRGANANPVLFDRLVGTAEKHGIPYQTEAEPGASGTDGWAMQISRAGIAAGVVSVPLRYMHTAVETLSLADLDATVKLLAELVLSLEPGASFVP